MDNKRTYDELARDTIENENRLMLELVTKGRVELFRDLTQSKLECMSSGYDVVKRMKYDIVWLHTAKSCLISDKYGLLEIELFVDVLNWNFPSCGAVISHPDCSIMSPPLQCDKAYSKKWTRVTFQDMEFSLGGEGPPLTTRIALPVVQSFPLKEGD